jgi:RNA polymerase sigma-70 factor, ECF subfamily
MLVLFERHADALWRYALRLTGDPARAELVVQETLLRASKRAEIADDSEQSTRAWLFAVARMVIDKRRISRFHNDVNSQPEVNAAMDRLLVGDALAQLPAEHRTVVRGSYYLGQGTGQIAEDLQIAEGAVKSRLHYAVRALRLALQEKGLTR